MTSNLLFYMCTVTMHQHIKLSVSICITMLCLLFVLQWSGLCDCNAVTLDVAACFAVGLLSIGSLHILSAIATVEIARAGCVWRCVFGVDVRFHCVCFVLLSSCFVCFTVCFANDSGANSLPCMVWICAICPSMDKITPSISVAGNTIALIVSPTLKDATCSLTLS